MTTDQAFKGAAIIVSVDSNMDPKIPDLGPSVRRDADAVAAVLTNSETCAYSSQRIQRLSGEDATAENIEAAVHRAAAYLEADDPFLLFFTGHGGMDGSKAFLKPYDTVDITGDNRLTTARISACLANVNSDRKLLVVDACHSGGIGTVVGKTKSGESGVQNAYFQLAQGSGIVVISSSREDQKSFILTGDLLSLFTKHFVAGLNGAAARQGESLIGVFDIFNYVAEAVRRDAPSQEPVYSAYAQTNNFAVAIAPAKQCVVQKSSIDNKNCAPMTGTDIFSLLYPLGPTERDIWERAGGDVARLDLSQTGRTAWFRALRDIKRGGGVPLAKLVGTALNDYPLNQRLITLKSL